MFNTDTQHSREQTPIGHKHNAVAHSDTHLMTSVKDEFIGGGPGGVSKGAKILSENKKTINPLCLYNDCI